MERLNTYLDQQDLSEVATFFLQRGKKRIFTKKDFFIRQNEIDRFAGYVQNGAFRFCCTDESGKEHVVGYAFENEYICDYASFLKRGKSRIDIQAITDSNVYIISLDEYLEFCKLASSISPDFRSNLAESLFEMAYSRLLDLYCDTPKQRYVKLIQRCPDLKELVPLKEIASFIGVTPETVSHIRRKLRNK